MAATFLRMAEKQTCLFTCLMYCGDLDRLALAKTCVYLKHQAVPYTPCRERFRTLTRPTYLPGFFIEEREGVWSIPKVVGKADSFTLSMMKHLDRNPFGISLLRWWAHSSSIHIVPGSILLSKTILAKLMVENQMQKNLLKERILENIDTCIHLDTGLIWDEVLLKNTSIRNIVFIAKKDQEAPSYMHVLPVLDKR